MNTPAKSLLVYDGRCAFCRLWIDRWKSITGDSTAYTTSADYEAAGESTDRPAAAASRPPIPAEEFRKSVVLVRPDGTYLTGALAVFTALESSSAGRLALFLYRKLPGFGPFCEKLYRSVSTHRDESYLLTRVLWGNSVVPPGFAGTRWIFLRGMAAIYAVAFASLSPQILGLVGSKGISPAEMFLEAVHARIGSAGILYYPTLAWFDPGDGFLAGMCVAGMICAGMLMAGIAPRIAAFLCWLLYFSLAVAGQVFLRFQWDSLLLEAGLLTIFYAPKGWMRFRADAGEPHRAVRWLLWLLVFRLMFMSGVVKLSAADPNWWNLTALSYHYQTQCLPNPVAWHAFQLPLWFHKLSAFLMFMIEIGAPFLLFTPRRLRHLGAFMLIGLQCLIILTGNFAFFNWLSIVLCLALLDDGVTRKLIPRFLRGRMPGEVGRAGTEHSGAGSDGAASAGEPLPAGRSFRPMTLPGRIIFALMLLLNFNQLAGLAIPRSMRPSPVETFSAWAAHFHVVEGYGLFRVMTTKRPEIIIEGSDDRASWKPYGFRYKPDDVGQQLPWAAPHQPRLDWQMWFAALSDYRSQTWVVNLGIRLLEGSPDVVALLEENPFPGRPPHYIRALLYEYRFSTPSEREATGAVWVRTLNSVYMPPFSLSGS